MQNATQKLDPYVHHTLRRIERHLIGSLGACIWLIIHLLIFAQIPRPPFLPYIVPSSLGLYIIYAIIRTTQHITNLIHYYYTLKLKMFFQPNAEVAIAENEVETSIVCAHDHCIIRKDCQPRGNYTKVRTLVAYYVATESVIIAQNAYFLDQHFIKAQEVFCLYLDTQ